MCKTSKTKLFIENFSTSVEYVNIDINVLI